MIVWPLGLKSACAVFIYRPMQRDIAIPFKLIKDGMLDRFTGFGRSENPLMVFALKNKNMTCYKTTVDI